PRLSPEQPDQNSHLAVIGIALGGAYLAYRFVEQPIQRSSLGYTRWWHGHAVAAGLVVPVAIAAIVGTAVLAPASNGQGSNLSTADYPGGTVPASFGTAIRPGIPIQPVPAPAKQDWPRAYRDKCHQLQPVSTVIACTYGDDNAPMKAVALVGGSHSAHWLAALEALAQQNGWRIVSITKSSCPFEVKRQRKVDCIEWNENVVDYLRNLQPNAIFTTSSRPYRGDPKGANASQSRAALRKEYIPKGYLQQWARMAEMDLTIIAVRDSPWLGVDVPECIERNPTRILDCSRDRDQVTDRTDPTSKLRTKPMNVEFIDLTDRFCDQSVCFPVNGNLLIYSDAHQLPATFSRRLAPVLGERIRQVRPDLFAAGSGS
ncbi:SGNH hydrolase domain-containing protein, partial [Microvirga roseola]|uniref:SGNH hydrolase domain-containing protein n=1 Tax=Microvirga roseola TaxID=2883126 RepID=UPI001E62EF8F